MCYGGCDCQRCNPPEEPVRKRSAWSPERPTTAGWYWVRRPKDPWLGPEIRAVTQPNGPDTDYLEVDDIPLDEYVNDCVEVEWQSVQPPVE